MPRRRPIQGANPARLLHDTLTRYVEAANFDPALTHRDSWAQALEVRPDEALQEMGLSLGLVTRIKDALYTIGDLDYIAIFQRSQDAWGAAFIPESFGQRARGASAIVDVEPMQDLAVIASFLDREWPSAALPSDEDQLSLTDLIESAISDIEADEELDAGFASLLIRRLSDMRWALAHIRVAGPDGLAAATDRLAMVIVIDQAAHHDETDENATTPDRRAARRQRQKLLEIVTVALTLIDLPGSVHGTVQAIEAASHSGFGGLLGG